MSPKLRYYYYPEKVYYSLPHCDHLLGLVAKFRVKSGRALLTLFLFSLFFSYFTCPAIVLTGCVSLGHKQSEQSRPSVLSLSFSFLVSFFVLLLLVVVRCPTALYHSVTVVFFSSLFAGGGGGSTTTTTLVFVVIISRSPLSQSQRGVHRRKVSHSLDQQSIYQQNTQREELCIPARLRAANAVPLIVTNKITCFDCDRQAGRQVPLEIPLLFSRYYG